jgi:NAD(P)-dependent dehydrogenase (short-subunit alcohol dehydrogenase family)
MLSHAATISARALHRVGVGDVARRAAAARGVGVGRRIGGGRVGGSGTHSSRRPRVARVFDRRAFRGAAHAAADAPSSSSSSSSSPLPFSPLPDVPLSPHVSLVSGASRGIGLEMVRQLLERPDASMRGRPSAAGGHVVAACRDPSSATALAELRARYPTRLSVVRMDVTDVAAIEAAAATVAAAHGRVDALIQTAAVLHVAGEMAPETSIARLDERSAIAAFRTNALGPTLVVKHFANLLHEATARARAEAKEAAEKDAESDSRDAGSSAPAAVVANLSARVSSVGDNRLGGWHSYRASKSALNQLTKNCAIEFARKKHPVTFLLLHPGTVATDLSAPFRRNVPEGKLFAPEFAAERLLGIVGEKTQEDTGKFFAWDGEEVQW